MTENSKRPSSVIFGTAIYHWAQTESLWRQLILLPTRTALENVGQKSSEVLHNLHKYWFLKPDSLHGCRSQRICSYKKIGG